METWQHHGDLLTKQMERARKRLQNSNIDSGSGSEWVEKYSTAMSLIESQSKQMNTTSFASFILSVENETNRVNVRDCM